jgi:phosphatidylglycerophosphate synthase
MSEEDKVERIYTSLFENWFERVCIRLAPFVPQGVTPNQLTVVAFGGMLVAGLGFYLAGFNRAWFAAAVAGLIVHLVLDNVDGAVARARGMTSEKGQFLDIFADCLGTSALLIGIGFSAYSYTRIPLLSPILWLLHLALMYNWILLRKKWIFPLFSNFEIHASLIVMAILSMIFGKFEVFQLFHHPFGLFDTMIGVMLPIGFAELLYSAARLYRQLNGVSLRPQEMRAEPQKISS